jgi:WD40 repeat protein
VARLDDVAWAPDGGQLAAAGAAGVLFATGLDPGATLTRTQGYTLGVWAPSLAFSPDGRSLALGSVVGVTRLFNRSDGGLQQQLIQPELRVSRVAFRPGPTGVLSEYAATLGGDNTVYLWDVAYRKFLGPLAPGHSNAGVMTISGDGHWLAAAADNQALVWDLYGLPLAAGWSDPISPTLALGQDGDVTAVALSADGFWLAAANASGYITVWSLPTGEQRVRLAQLPWPATRLAFSPDATLLASAHADNNLRLWAWQLVTQVSRPGIALVGHTGPVTGLAFSPSGTALASSSWDGTVRLWGVGR